jgi:pilus assembly protein Flp/PilA
VRKEILETGPLSPGGTYYLSTHLFTHGLAPEEETTMYLYLYLKNLLESEEGQDLIEYALIIVLVVIVAVAGMYTLGGQIAGIWTKIGGWITGATTGA